MRTEEIISFLKADENFDFTTDTPASSLTSFRVGGRVRVVAYPKNRDAFCELTRRLASSETKYVVLGCGSNVLAPDEGYDGVFVMTTKLTGLSIEGNTLTAECGRGITSCASSAARAGLGGLAFAYGIPGSVGGAVYMNAGAYGSEIKDIIISADCWDAARGEVLTLTKDELRFGYRDSALRHNGLTVLSAAFSLFPEDTEKITAEMNDYMNRRRDKQPLEYPSAGSVFKRAPGHFTGKLIEDAGLKGYRVGGAEVSEKHAGFIINAGGATAEDVKTLVAVIEARVFELFGVRLERELIYL